MYCIYKKKFLIKSLFILMKNIFCKKISFPYTKFIQLKDSHVIFIIKNIIYNDIRVKKNNFHFFRAEIIFYNTTLFIYSIK